MRTIRKINLEVNNFDCPVIIDAKQADDNSRFINVQLTENHAPIQVPAGATVRLRTLKPDGTSALTTGTRNTDGTVTVELTEQVLAVEGTVKADISILQGNEILSSANFRIKVQAVPLGAEIVSSNEFTALTEMTERAEQAIEELESVVKTVPQTLTAQEKEQAMENIGAQPFVGLYVVNNKICMEV